MCMQANLRSMLSQAFCVLALDKGCPVYLHYARLLLHLLLDELRFKYDTFVYCSCPQLTPSHLHGTLALSWDQVSASPAACSNLCNDKLVNWLLFRCLSCLQTYVTASQCCISHRSSCPIKALPSQPLLLLNTDSMMYITATNFYTIAAAAGCRVLFFSGRQADSWLL
jgi:hypothetical protein